MSLKNVLVVVFAGILWSCVMALQRPPPRYSQQFMPDTSFTCRNKIVGSYYADPETDCQVFHVCVSVAGNIQDYKFLCPNDTAFDQESQTCADWYDVDCDAPTLYYASDNFDLYRLGSGLESLHYDSIRTDAEPQDNLQRSETNDPVRSAANNLNQVSQNNNYNTQSNPNNNNRDILRGSSSSNFYNSRNNGKDEDYDTEKSYKEEPVEPRKKSGVRKVARKHQLNNGNNVNNINTGNSYISSTTVAPSSTNNYNNGNYNGNYNNNFNNYNIRRTTHEPLTTIRPIPQQDYNNKQYNQNNQKYNSPVTSTYRPTTLQQNYQSSSTTIRPSPFVSNKNYNGNYQGDYRQTPTTVKSVSFSQSLQHSPTTSRPTTYNQNYQNFGNHAYNMQYTSDNDNNNGRQQSSTFAPSTNYQHNDHDNFQQKNYNNIQRSSTTIGVSTTSASTRVDNYNTNGNYNNQNNGRSSNAPSVRSGSAQTTKFYPNYSPTSYVPTTYSPVPVKKTSNGNYNNNSNDNGQYYDKNTQPSKSTQYYDSTKAPKKATQNVNYDSTNTGKYFETSTINYDFARSQAAIGFSPSSINLLAESPRSTTPVSRRTGAPTTYNPNNYNHRVTFQQQHQQSTTARSVTSGTTKQSSTNAAFTGSTSSRPKSTKKNDYDYAYYDNAGGLEYDGLDLDHVARNKESSKISRN